MLATFVGPLFVIQFGPHTLSVIYVTNVKARTSSVLAGNTHSRTCFKSQTPEYSERARRAGGRQLCEHLTEPEASSSPRQGLRGDPAHRGGSREHWAHGFHREALSTGALFLPKDLDAATPVLILRK